MIKKYIKIISIIMICIVLSACSITGSEEKSQENNSDSIESRNNDDIMDKGPVKGGVLKLFSTTPDTLNPIITKNSYVLDFSTFIYEGLVQIDKEQKPSPVLADKWSVSEDGLTWTFHIRENVMWQDKMPLTAEDVEFTVQNILSANSESIYKKNLENVTTFGAVDRNNFRIILKNPYSFTAEQMIFPIMPKHYYVGEDFFKSKRNEKPIGTGPYKFLSYNETDGIKLKINQDWWNSKSKGSNEQEFPYIEELNIKTSPNTNNAVNSFQSREIDVLPITIEQYGKYNGRSDLNIKKYIGKNFEYITFNMAKAPLSDKVVRQALAYALDKPKLIFEAIPGQAIPADIPVIPGSWLYNTKILAYTPDKAKVKELLTKNGWALGSDKIYYKNIGGVRTTLSFELMVNEENTNRVKTAEQMAKMFNDSLDDFGMKITVKKVSWEDENKLINSRRFDMALIGCRIPSIPDLSFLYSSTPAGILNTSRYNNSYVDTYLQQILTEKEESKKIALFQNMKAIIDDEVPYLGLYFYNNAILYNKKVRGDVSPYYWNKFNDVTKWYIPLR